MVHRLGMRTAANGTTYLNSGISILLGFKKIYKPKRIGTIIIKSK